MCMDCILNPDDGCVEVQHSTIHSFCDLVITHGRCYIGCMLLGNKTHSTNFFQKAYRSLDA